MEFVFRGVKVKVVAEHPAAEARNGCDICAVKDIPGVACLAIHREGPDWLGEYCTTKSSNVGKHGHYFVKVEEQQ